MYHEKGLHCGPFNKFIHLCKEYDLLSVIKGAIEECDIPKKEVWKILVRDKHNKVWYVENRIGLAMQISH